jgi:cytochrome bd-type quinol oxidase subunit 2
MDIRLRRLRRGEVIVGASALLLLVFVFALTWYEQRTVAGEHTFTGWQGLPTARWLLLVTIVAALALVYFQAARRTPAIPVTLSVVVTVLALLTAIALIYKVLINPPGPSSVDVKVGAYLGLVSSLALLYGGFASMRREGISSRDAPAEIEVVPLERPGGS